MSTKLKPCPFCGSKAVLHKATTKDSHPYHVRCTSCYCMFADWFAEEREAARRWNMRAVEK